MQRFRNLVLTLLSVALLEVRSTCELVRCAHTLLCDGIQTSYKQKCIHSMEKIHVQSRTHIDLTHGWFQPAHHGGWKHVQDPNRWRLGRWLKACSCFVFDMCICMIIGHPQHADWHHHTLTACRLAPRPHSMPIGTMPSISRDQATHILTTQS